MEFIVVLRDRDGDIILNLQLEGCFAHILRSDTVHGKSAGGGFRVVREDDDGGAGTNLTFRNGPQSALVPGEGAADAGDRAEVVHINLIRGSGGRGLFELGGD